MIILGNNLNYNFPHTTRRTLFKNESLYNISYISVSHQNINAEEFFFHLIYTWFKVS